MMMMMIIVLVKGSAKCLGWNFGAEHGAGGFLAPDRRCDSVGICQLRSAISCLARQLGFFFASCHNLGSFRNRSKTQIIGAYCLVLLLLLPRCSRIRGLADCCVA